MPLSTGISDRSHTAVRSTTDKSDSKNDRLLASEGFLLAAAPFVGAALTLMFESGFLSHYNVPMSFVVLDLPLIARTSLGTALGLALFTYVSVLMHEWDRNRASLTRRLVGSSWPWLFAPLILVLSFPSDPTYWWLLPGGLAIMVVGTLINAWRLGHKDKSLRSNAMAILDAEWDRDQKSPRPTTSQTMMFVGALLLALFLAVRQQGLRIAESRSEYWVLADEPTLAMIERYGDTVIFRKFDPTTNELSTELQLRKIGEEPALRLTLVKTGKLAKQRQPAVPASGPNNKATSPAPLIPATPTPSTSKNVTQTSK